MMRNWTLHQSQRRAHFVIQLFVLERFGNVVCIFKPTRLHVIKRGVLFVFCLLQTRGPVIQHQ